MRVERRRRTRLRAGIRRFAQFAGATFSLAVVLVAGASAGPTAPLHGSVTVVKEGSGSGTVVSSPAGIDCGGVCSGSFISDESPEYRAVSLGIEVAPGSRFDGWGGACTGTGGCRIDPVKMNGSYTVTAYIRAIRPSQFPVVVSVSGSGRVTSAPAGIDCGEACTASFPTDSTITLTATPIPGWTFAGWGGSCNGTDPCTLKVSDPRSVTATFAPPETAYALAVSAEGGTVVSDFGGISCVAACVGSFGSGVTVTLTAVGTGVTWGGSCSGGAQTCALTMTGPRSVTAAFGGATPTQAPLAVAVVGKGTVASTPAGVECGAVCGALYPLNSAVTLSAGPAEGWAFAGWRGACTGVAQSCRTTMVGPRTVTAVFVESGTRYPVAVTKAGSGLVRSRPAGIACGATCSSSFLAGRTVALEAQPADGWRFARWSGACTHTRPVCSVGMDGPKSLSVTFGRVGDRVAPVVRAIRSTGEPGAIAQLRYRVREQGGRSRETATVFRGRTRIATVRGRMHAVEPDVLFYFLPWRVPASTRSGDLRFCVVSVDPTGNRSRRACAPLRVGQ